MSVAARLAGRCSKSFWPRPEPATAACATNDGTALCGVKSRFSDGWRPEIHQEARFGEISREGHLGKTRMPSRQISLCVSANLACIGGVLFMTKMAARPWQTNCDRDVETGGQPDPVSTSRDAPGPERPVCGPPSDLYYPRPAPDRRFPFRGAVPLILMIGNFVRLS
jgi:hypothetical protein